MTTEHSDAASQQPPPSVKTSLKAALQIAGSYLIFSVLWIILSDRAIESMFKDIETLSLIQTYKGLFFIALTTALIFWLTSRLLRAQQRAIDFQRTLLETIPDIVWAKDLQGRYTACNGLFAKISGNKQTDIIGSTDYDLFKKKIADKLQKKDEQVLAADEPQAFEETVHYADSSQRTIVETLKAPIRNPKGVAIGTLGISRDITERKHHEDHISKLAFFDTLTGLPNRLSALKQLERLLEDASSERAFAVFFVDLDDFKKINDTLGHDTGDKLLQQAAQRLNQTVGTRGTVGRLGGDEFIVFSRPTDASDSKAYTLLGRDLLECFTQPFTVDERQLRITTSIGITCYPQDGKDQSELLRNADTAMYQAKAAGRNTMSYFTAQMAAQVSRRMQIEQHMHQALKDKQFEVLYQPQYDVHSHTIVGVEALLRWTHPDIGPVSPDEFIPIAEHSGLIVQLGELVLTQGLRDCARWHEKGAKHLTLSINVSPRQCLNSEFVEHLQTTVAAARFPRDKLELEITEGVLLSANKLIHDCLTQLHQSGFILAMDDFGSGYSSINYLRHYPFSVLKIDKSFVQDIDTKRSDLELLHAAISMAQGLGLHIIAEGVEKDEQLKILADLGCHRVQGTLLGMPQPAEALEAELNNITLNQTLPLN